MVTQTGRGRQKCAGVMSPVPLSPGPLRSRGHGDARALNAEAARFLVGEAGADFEKAVGTAQWAVRVVDQFLQVRGHELPEHRLKFFNALGFKTVLFEDGF